MYQYLNGRLRQLGIRQQDLAARWGMSQPTISHRFCGRIPWTIDEMYDLLSICHAKPEELHIYFPPKGTYFCGKSDSTVQKLPLYLTVEIEQPTSENLQISCSVQQYKIT